MHDLFQVFSTVKKSILKVAKDYFAKDGNSKFYPNPPKLSDLDVIALSFPTGIGKQQDIRATAKTSQCC